jgi:hypothetical protein
LAAVEKYAVEKNIMPDNTSLNSIAVDTIPENSSLNSKEEKNQLPENILYVLNGKIIGKGKEAQKKLSHLSPETIDSLTVLKNENAINKYGASAKDGVIEIFTKKSIEGNHQSSLYKKGNASFTVDDKVFTQVENEPKFPGGDSAWRRYLEKNLNPGIPVDNGAPGGIYKVIVKFIVNKDGSISDVQAETKHGYGMDSAAVELIKKGPKWEPALQNNHIVTAYKKQPITFVIEEQ